MRDFVTFRVKEAESQKRFMHECKDSTSETGYSLLTTVDSTHAGLVNGNMRFYRPDHMQDSCHTWTPANKPKRPVLVRHDEDCDPLGRVVKARYIDESYKYVGRYAQLKSTMFYDSGAKRLDLFKSVDFVYNTLQRKNKDFQGLGYCELGLNITNPDAIAKVQREEYLTVSVGFNTDAAICSVCHQDWSLDGRCEHRLGEVVDGKRMFLISGMFDYEECSFVNFPADPFAGVKSKEVMSMAKDSMALRVFLMGQTFDEEVGLFRSTDSISAECADMLEADIQVVSDEEEDLEMELDSIRSEIHSKDLTKERALEIRKDLAGNKDAKRLLTSLNAKIRKNGWGEDAADGVFVETKETVEAKIAGLVDALKALPAADRKTYLDAVEVSAGTHGLEVPAVNLDELDGKPAAADKAPSEVSDPNAGAPQFKDSKDGNKFVGSLDSLVGQYKALDDDDKSTARSLLYQTYEVLCGDQYVEYLRSRLSKDPNSKDCLVAKDELETLQDGFDQAESDLAKLQQDKLSLSETNKTLVRDQKLNLATMIVMYSVLSGEKGFVGLSQDKIQAEISQRATRQLVSLQDSLQDLKQKLSISVDLPAEEKPVEDGADAPAETNEAGTKPVDDNANVQDSADQPGEVTPAEADAQAEETPRGEGTTARPFATIEDIRAMREQASVDLYRRLKQETQNTEK